MIFNFIYRLLLTFNATSLIIVVFLIKEKTTVNSLHERIETFPNWASYLIYAVVPLLLTLLSIFLSRFLSKDNIKRGSIKEVEQASNAFLPSYLGYFFVALSVNNYDTLVYIYLILFVFTFLSQTLYFNPLFLFFGYNFFYIKNESNVTIFVITKNLLKKPLDVEFTELKRINNYTYID